MSASSGTVPSRPVHGMIPGSHERGNGPECRCGAGWDRYYETCANKTREDLLALAVQVDDARKAANAIHAVAPQGHAYGDLAEALKKVLAVITEDAMIAEDVYDSIVCDGSSVTEALDWVARNRV